MSGRESWQFGSTDEGAKRWKAHVEFAGAVYHLLDRGDRQEEIFRNNSDKPSGCGSVRWKS